MSVEPLPYSNAHREDGSVKNRVIEGVLITVVSARALMKVTSSAGVSWDFVNFYNAGRRIAAGQLNELYAAPLSVGGEPVAGTGLLQYVGFPISAVVFAPLGALPVRWALLTLKTACAACFALGLTIIYKHCRDHVGGIWRSKGSLAIYLILILFFEPFWFVFSIGGQATPAAFLLLTIAVSAHTAGRFWPAAACLSVAILLKPAFALGGLIFLFAGAWPLLSRLAVCLALEGALSWAVFGWQRHLEWAQMIVRESRRWAVPWWNNSSILGAIADYWTHGGIQRLDPLAPPSAFTSLQAALRLLLVVLFFRMMRRAPDSELEREGQRQYEMLMAILFPLFFSTVVWPHYLVIAFIPLLVLTSYFPLLPLRGRLLLTAALLSTMGTNLRVTAWLDSALPADPIYRIPLISVLAASTLLLTLVLIIGCGNLLRRLGSDGASLT